MSLVTGGLETLAYSFGGNKISQSWHDLFIWEQVLNRQEPVRILELGTFTGGMASYLHVQALMRGAEFMSFDSAPLEAIRLDRPDSPYTSSWKFSFRQMDVFTSASIKYIGDMIKLPGQTVLFCDNGNKPHEMLTYVPLLKVDDIVAVHDWGTEFMPAHVPPGLQLYEPIPCMYEELQSMTRFFTKC